MPHHTPTRPGGGPAPAAGTAGPAGAAAVTPSRTQNSPEQAGGSGQPVPARPAVTFDPAAARAWLDDPDRPQELSGLDVDDADKDTYPSYHDLRLFLTGVQELVDAAADAGLFGGHAGVSVRLTADYDGLSGAYVMLDVPRPTPGHRTGGVRFASLYQEPADLTDDTAATGTAAAASILHAVARTAAEVLARAWQTFDQPPPAQPRPCGCGADHIYPNGPDGETAADGSTEGRDGTGRADYWVTTGPDGSEAAARLAAAESGEHTYAALDQLAGTHRQTYQAVLRRHGLEGDR